LKGGKNFAGLLLDEEKKKARKQITAAQVVT